MDETTIVDVDGPARIIDPQDDVRLAIHHRYGCSFDAAVCAYKTGCLCISGTGSWCNSLTSEMCAILFTSEHLGAFCNSDWICESSIELLLILYCVFVIDLCVFVVYILRILRLDR